MKSETPSCIPSSGLKGVTWPAIPQQGAAQIMSLLYQLEQSQWWDMDTMWQHQLSQLTLLLEHAAKTVPYYMQRYSADNINTGGIKTFADWQQLPLLTRADVQAAGEQLYSTATPRAHGNHYVVRTSGSTGMPIKVKGTELTKIFWKVLNLRDHLWQQRDFSGTLMALRAERPEKPGEIIRAKGWGAGVDTVYPTGPAIAMSTRTDVSRQAKLLRDEDPEYLLSLPSNIKALAMYFREQGWQLSKLRQVRCYGENVSDELRELCQQVFGVPVCDVYSSQEVGQIAQPCHEHGHYHVQSENLLVEVLDEQGRQCQPGEVGQVVITTLHNFATPLIRYCIGDYAEVGEPCPCGRGLPVLKQIMGRQRNMIVLPDGRQHWPSFPSGQWMDIAPLKQMQLVQETEDKVTARVVSERSLSESEQDELVSYLQERFQYPFNIEIEYCDVIPRSKAGKFEDFVSKL